MQIMFMTDRQEPEALSEAEGQLKDITSLTDSVVHIPLGKTETIKVLWSYAYYRIPVTRISKEPEFLSRDSVIAPPPAIENVSLIIDPVTNKAIGVQFDVFAKYLDSWECNVQTEHTYFEEVMGREYTHRRMASFTVSTQAPIDRVLEALS